MFSRSISDRQVVQVSLECWVVIGCADESAVGDADTLQEDLNKVAARTNRSRLTVDRFHEAGQNRIHDGIDSAWHCCVDRRVDAVEGVLQRQRQHDFVDKRVAQSRDLHVLGLGEVV
jgi:hypothetical protein